MGATILILASDKWFVGRLRTLLYPIGYSVLSASNVAGGMATLRELHNRIHLVIVGPGLPAGTGSKVSGTIARWKSRPKVIVTSEEQDKETYLDADRTVVKPGTDQDWLTAVNTLLDVRSPPR